MTIHDAANLNTGNDVFIYQAKRSVVTLNDHMLPHFVEVPLIFDRNCIFLWKEPVRSVLDII